MIKIIMNNNNNTKCGLFLDFLHIVLFPFLHITLVYKEESVNRNGKIQIHGL